MCDVDNNSAYNNAHSPHKDTKAEGSRLKTHNASKRTVGHPRPEERAHPMSTPKPAKIILSGASRIAPTPGYRGDMQRVKTAATPTTTPAPNSRT